MTQLTTPLHPLTTTSPAIVGATAFEGDLLSREKLAKRLTGYLDRLKSGAVLAIDAQWGDGKTWFGRNWAKHLKDNNHKVIFIDAFEQDYIEDPFLLIAAEIVSTLDDGKNGAQRLKKKAIDVMQAIMPVGAKTAINAAGRLFLGSVELTDGIEKSIEAASKSGADAASKWIEKKLKDYAKDKESLRHFKEELAFFAKEQNKPIVIFIDELDRCRPDFAVKLIERIKHFFNVPNVVFVLLINRTQLEKAIKGVYGVQTNAAEYLSKFVNFFFTLPIKYNTERNEFRHLTQYVSNALTQYKFEINQQRIDAVREYISILAVNHNLSLRDIERAVALYSLAQPIHERYDSLLIYQIGLKLKYPDLFKRLVLGDLEAHKEAKEKVLDSRNGEWFYDLAREMHNLYTSNFSDIGNNIGSLFKGQINLNNIFEIIAKKIDLSIEN